jgi:molybdate-binding protein/predicted nucleic acid-binding protein
MATPHPIRALLDTSYCLFLIRRRPAEDVAALATQTPGSLAVSALTVAALRRHAWHSSNPERNQQAIEQFLLPLTVLDFDSSAACTLGALGAAADSAGSHDLLLAAQALQHRAVLVTARPDRYAKIPALRVCSRLSQIDLLPTGRSPAPYTIHLSGSHDLSLNVLADWLHAEHPDRLLTADPVGSLLGLMSLLQGTAHLAGSHLFDAATGDFNIGPVHRILAPSGLHVVIVGFVERVQGLLVARGNPRQIHSLADLARGDVHFINRQRGAGTRVLLDYQLGRLALDPCQIQGYTDTAPTHLAVAASVAQGNADCGLGIQAAAQVFNLEFLPVAVERFDLVIPVEYFESALLAPLLALLRRRDPGFCSHVAALGGYNTWPMGQLLAEV